MFLSVAGCRSERPTRAFKLTVPSRVSSCVAKSNGFGGKPGGIQGNGEAPRKAALLCHETNRLALTASRL